MIVVLGCVNPEDPNTAGNDDNTDIVSDTDSGTDADSGTDSDSGTNADSGTDFDSGTDADANSDSDTDIDVGPDCNSNGIADSQEQDTDGDGVIDDCDACGGTPAGTSVDETGCPIILKSGLTTAVSRRQHAQATYDLNIPLNDALVEPRQNGDAPQMVLIYNQPPTNPGCAGVTIVNGTCIDVTVSDSRLIIDMTYDDNACVQVTVGNDTLQVLTHIANVDDDAYVSIDDLKAIKLHVFEVLDAAKCVYDTNCDGTLNVTDLQTAKDNISAPLPSCN
jgi:hypothetical protein